MRAAPAVRVRRHPAPTSAAQRGRESDAAATASRFASARVAEYDSGRRVAAVTNACSWSSRASSGSLSQLGGGEQEWLSHG